MNNQISVKSCKAPLGFGCLGNQFIIAFEYYKSFGDHFFSMVTEKGMYGLLPIV